MSDFDSWIAQARSYGYRPQVEHVAGGGIQIALVKDRSDDIQVPVEFRRIERTVPAMYWHYPFAWLVVAVVCTVMACLDGWSDYAVVSWRVAMAYSGIAILGAAIAHAAMHADQERRLPPPSVPAGQVLVAEVPPLESCEGLARDIVMWTRFGDPHRGDRLHNHLRALGREIPSWLTDLIPDTMHVPPKGNVAEAIYRAVVEAQTKG